MEMLSINEYDIVDLFVDMQIWAILKRSLLSVESVILRWPLRHVGKFFPLNDRVNFSQSGHILYQVQNNTFTLHHLENFE